MPNSAMLLLAAIVLASTSQASLAREPGLMEELMSLGSSLSRALESRSAEGVHQSAAGIDAVKLRQPLAEPSLASSAAPSQENEPAGSYSMGLSAKEEPPAASRSDSSEDDLHEAAGSMAGGAFWETYDFLQSPATSAWESDTAAGKVGGALLYAVVAPVALLASAVVSAAVFLKVLSL